MRYRAFVLVAPGMPAARVKAVVGVKVVALACVVAWATATSALASTNSWSVDTTPQPTYSQLYDVSCSGSSDCWAVGGPLFERNTGAGWSVFPTPSLPAGARDLSCANESDCWAVTSGSIGHFDGTSWAPVSFPNASTSVLTSVACVDSIECWATGTDTSSPEHAIMDHFSNGVWSEVANPIINADLRDLSCVSGIYDCWAVGDANNAPLIEQNTGAGWTVVPNPVSVRSTLYSVSCLSGSDCWAVGDENPYPSPLAALTEHFNGAAWTVVATPHSLNVVLEGVTCVSHFNCWAVGFRGFNQRRHQVIEHYRASGWVIASQPAGVGILSLLSAIACEAKVTCWAVGVHGSPFTALIEVG